MNYNYQNIINSLTNENLKYSQLIEFYEKELAEKKEQLLKLELANKRKLEFICHLAHDFKTPLNAIKGFATLIIEDSLSNEIQNNFCKNILTASDYLLHLVNYTLEISYNENNHIILNYEKFNPAKIIAEVLCILNEQLKGKNIIVDTQLCHLQIIADKQRFKQLIYNLIGNAYKFNKIGGQINIKTTLKENDFYFEIKDTGCGINLENQHKIFDFFACYDHKIHNIKEHSGIGLSLCKKIIELHGGKIEFESTIELGTTFWFHIPIEPKILNHNDYITLSKKL